MACPYFYPVDRVAIATGRRMPPAPLGDTWSGICRAAPQSPAIPDAATVQQCCNFGYARPHCARISGDGADAVRFAISHDRDGLIRIYWVMEKDHLPFAHGPLDFSSQGEPLSSHPDACMAQQASAFVSSYLRRKAETVRP